MNNNRMTIDETLQMLNKLLDSGVKRTVLINTDSESTYDSVRSFADGNKLFLVKYNDITGHLEPHHKVLLDYNLSYYQEQLQIDSLKEELSLYEKDQVSIVFLAKGIRTIDGLPHNIEVINCYNPDALTVGDFIDAFNRIKDKQLVIAFCEREGSSDILGFLPTSPSPRIAFSQVVIGSITDVPYNVSNMLQILSTFDRQLPISFQIPRSRYSSYAYDIEVFEGDIHNGSINFLRIFTS